MADEAKATSSNDWFTCRIVGNGTWKVGLHRQHEGGNRWTRVKYTLNFFSGVSSSSNLAHHRHEALAVTSSRLQAYIPSYQANPTFGQHEHRLPTSAPRPASRTTARHIHYPLR